MSELSDPRSADFSRDPARDGDVRNQPWWQELTGHRFPAPDSDPQDEAVSASDDEDPPA